MKTREFVLKTGVLLTIFLFTAGGFAASFLEKPFGDLEVPDLTKPIRDAPGKAFKDTLRPSLNELDRKLTLQRKEFIQELDELADKKSEKIASLMDEVLTNQREAVAIELENLTAELGVSLEKVGDIFLDKAQAIATATVEATLGKAFTGFAFGGKVLAVVLAIALGGGFYVLKHSIPQSITVTVVLSIVSFVAIHALESNEGDAAEELACSSYPHSLVNWAAYLERAGAVRHTDEISRVALSILDLATTSRAMSADLSRKIRDSQIALMSKSGQRSRDLDLLYAMLLHKSAVTRLDYFIAAQVAADALDRPAARHLCESKVSSPFSMGAMSVLDAYLLTPFTPREIQLLSLKESAWGGYSIPNYEDAKKALFDRNNPEIALAKFRSTQELIDVLKLAQSRVDWSQQSTSDYRLIQGVRRAQLMFIERYATALYHHARAVAANSSIKRDEEISLRDRAARKGVEIWEQMKNEIDSAGDASAYDVNAIRLSVRPEFALRLASFEGSPVQRQWEAVLLKNPERCETIYKYLPKKVTKEDLQAHSQWYSYTQRSAMRAAIASEVLRVRNAVSRLEAIEFRVLGEVLRGAGMQQSTYCAHNKEVVRTMNALSSDPRGGDLDASTDLAIKAYPEQAPSDNKYFDFKAAALEPLWTCVADNCQRWGNPVQPLSLRLSSIFDGVQTYEHELPLLYRIAQPNL